jgi:hypothetical protein
MIVVWGVYDDHRLGHTVFVISVIVIWSSYSDCNLGCTVIIVWVIIVWSGALTVIVLQAVYSDGSLRCVYRDYYILTTIFKLARVGIFQVQWSSQLLASFKWLVADKVKLITLLLYLHVVILQYPSLCQYYMNTVSESLFCSSLNHEIQIKDYIIHFS